mmetsp:Transcript_38542/g.85818  ORF Transcript_38542/g.85818 Transcript_38542/m.85818 type:complete len:230 (+) Transcript_38542:15-704(+)
MYRKTLTNSLGNQYGVLTFVLRMTHLKLRLALCAAALIACAYAETTSTAERNAAFIGYQEKAGAAVKNIVITTSYGQIKLRPRPDLSPKIVLLVQQLADKHECHSCKFYRHEPAPENFGKNNFYGPPYALLQGSLADMAEQPPFEGNPVVRKGDVCIIPNSKEFFIATAGHEEWGHAHTVWAHVADEASWKVIDAIPVEPFTTITDNGGITTRWLTQNATIPFQLSIEA